MKSNANDDKHLHYSSFPCTDSQVGSENHHHFFRYSRTGKKCSFIDDWNKINCSQILHTECIKNTVILSGVNGCIPPNLGFLKIFSYKIFQAFIPRKDVQAKFNVSLHKNQIKIQKQ